MEQPAITIITVVYNAKAALEDTIKSVFSLAYKNIDLIIIDGGSQDGSVDVIKKHASSIFYWISEPDGGIYDAMNKGWNAAKKSSYILYLGAGDKVMSLPQRLSALYATVYYGDVMIGSKLFKSSHRWKLKLGSWLHHQALLIPKALHENPPFDTSFKLYADFDFNQRLLKKNIHFHYCDSFRSFALPDGMSAKRSNMEMLMVVKKNFGLLTFCASFVYFQLQELKRRILSS